MTRSFEVAPAQIKVAASQAGETVHSRHSKKCREDISLRRDPL